MVGHPASFSEPSIRSVVQRLHRKKPVVVAPGIVGRRRGGLPQRHFVVLEESCGGCCCCGCCGGTVPSFPFPLPDISLDLQEVA
ncbi:UNVERIFIED_CONTAM: hypothetical protein K2H54_041707 [Gekko kuhli]